MDAAAGPGPAPTPGSAIWTWVAGRPLWQHAVALLLVLGAFVPIIGTDSAFITDESYVVIQLDTIEDTGRWTVEHPLPEIDPEGAAFPLHGASRFEDGYTLYGKHPALIYLYLPVHRAFGIVGLVAVSVLGTWGAALAAAQLAKRLDAGAATVALWLVGAGSPLFFDAYVIHAHTIAAAIAGGAALCSLELIDRRKHWCGLAAAGLCLSVGLLRTEGAFFAAALGGVVGLTGLARRRLDLIAWGALVGLAAPCAYLIDRGWRVTNGAAVSVQSYPEAAGSFLDEQLTGAAFTLLMPGYRDGTLPEVLTALGAALLIGGAVILRRRPDDPGALLFPGVGAALLVVRSAMEWGPVPGLLVAAPVAVVGLVLLRAQLLAVLTSRLLLSVSGLFMLAVLGTQYAVGGHTEWGGRYFALVLPLLGAVAATALAAAIRQWPRPTARAVTGALVVAAVAMGGLGVSTLREAHHRNRSRADAVLAAAADLPGSGLPIVLTEDEQVPRLARGRHDQARFLMVPPALVDRYLERLARAGVDHLLLVSVDPKRSIAALPPSYAPVGEVEPHGLQYEDGGGLIHLRMRS